MSKVYRLFSILIVVMTTVAISASELSVSTKHDVLVTDDARKQLLRVVFVDEELLANVTLDVYVLKQLPSTRAHHAELQKLNELTWLDAVAWSLTTTDGQQVALPHPAILSRTVRRRGPDAVREVDRDTVVPMTTYRARLAFGSIPPGDYVLKASVRGLTSSFPFVARTGDEPGLRDHYLRLKAMRTRDYATFRRLQLERLERNPAQTDALYNLIDRALVQGTLGETQSFFERAIAAVTEYRRTSDDPTRNKQIDARIRELRATRNALPQYFANRAAWTMARDTKSGHYVIRDRRNKAVIRDFASSE